MVRRCGFFQARRTAAAVRAGVPFVVEHEDALAG